MQPITGMEIERIAKIASGPFSYVEEFRLRGKAWLSGWTIEPCSGHDGVCVARFGVKSVA